MTTQSSTSGQSITQIESLVDDDFAHADIIWAFATLFTHQELFLQPDRSPESQSLPRRVLGRGGSFIAKTATISDIHGTLRNEVVVFKRSIRVLRDSRVDENARALSILREIRILSFPDIRACPFIVNLLSITLESQDPDRQDEPYLRPILILEYSRLGDLATFFGASGSSGVDDEVKLKLVLDICRGLASLHRAGVTHGDMKPTNVLVFKNDSQDNANGFCAKLTDFGSSIINDAEPHARLRSFTPPWQAPEAGNATDRDGNLLEKTDLYSLGMVVWYMARNGTLPFSGSPFYFRESMLDDELKNVLSQIEAFKRDDGALDYAVDSIIVSLFHDDLDFKSLLQGFDMTEDDFQMSDGLCLPIMHRFFEIALRLLFFTLRQCPEERDMGKLIAFINRFIQDDTDTDSQSSNTDGTEVKPFNCRDSLSDLECSG
ncbi:kinase-like domain-containing protein [Dactylonectria macrodidyma]|uniref:Kinase-like domain-containing protein n=1 Tax=Dactylonectria macrodidyma TaxID=307937 RepID=A0A9P9EWF0_9HYPO|nr:kinase-like domain-containing protein [Dactylonectria macrodidyma]